MLDRLGVIGALLECGITSTTFQYRDRSGGETRRVADIPVQRGTTPSSTIDAVTARGMRETPMRCS